MRSAPFIRRNRLSQSTTNTNNNTYQPFSWRTSVSKQPQQASTSSESELSDSNNTNQTELSPRRQRDNVKFRINALLCLSAIAHTSPKALYPQWHKFLPDTFSIFLANNESSPFLKSDNQPLSLFTILLYDPVVNVRTAVCSTLISMLDGSKPYLSLALER